jgi:hypothetical protein
MRRVVIILGLGLSCTAALHGYLTWLPSYAELVAKAEAVVIAAPVERKEVPGPATLPGVTRGNDPIPAVEIRTTFVVSAVLSGSALALGSSFELQHYRESEPPTALRSAGPALVDFDPENPRNYLMFIAKRPDGIYVAVNPVEPAWCIEELDHPVERPAA